MKCQKHWTVSLSVEAFLPPCVFNQLWETPFLSPPALALPNEENITALR